MSKHSASIRYDLALGNQLNSLIQVEVSHSLKLILTGDSVAWVRCANMNKQRVDVWPCKPCNCNSILFLSFNACSQPACIPREDIISSHLFSFLSFLHTVLISGISLIQCVKPRLPAYARPRLVWSYTEELFFGAVSGENRFRSVLQKHVGTRNSEASLMDSSLNKPIRNPLAFWVVETLCLWRNSSGALIGIH